MLHAPRLHLGEVEELKRRRILEEGRVAETKEGKTAKEGQKKGRSLVSLCFMVLQFGAVPGIQRAGNSTPPSRKLLTELNCLFVTLRDNISYL